jgi:hypothetical protein
MSWQPSTLNFSDLISPELPEYLRIVKSSVDFCTNSHFWGLISHTGTSTNPASPINSFLETTIGHACNVNDTSASTFIPRFPNAASYTDGPAVVVIDKFIEFFNTPMKIIKCSDPDEYIYGIKSLCDGFFTHFVTNMGKSGSSQKYMVIVMDLISQLNNALPFKSDDGTLKSFMIGIQSYMNVSFRPTYHSSEYTPNLKSVIYASYYPYFVFLYILTFVSDTYRKENTFFDARTAKLACYLYVAHISSILHKVAENYSTHVSQANREAFDQKKMLIQQIMGNVSLNILGKESTDFDTNLGKWTGELDELSKSNTSINKKLLTDNEKYERYKQNLVSAANSEFSVQKQHKWTSFWMVFHIWFLIILTTVVTILIVIPAGKIPNNYDGLAVYVICGASILYTLVMGMIGTIRMLR